MRIPQPVRHLTPVQRQKRQEKMERRRALAAQRVEAEDEFRFIGPMNRAQALAQFRPDLPLYGAWSHEDPQETYWTALLARRMENGNLVFGHFLIDRSGAGLKECLGNVDFTESRFRRTLLERLREQGIDLQPADPDHIQRLIQAAVARARQGESLPEEWEEIGTLVAPLPEGEEPDFSLLQEEEVTRGESEPEAEEQAEEQPGAVAEGGPDNLGAVEGGEAEPTA